MDHQNQLDGNIYNISTQEHGPITIQTTKYQKYSETLHTIAQKHHIVNKVSKYIELDNCILFNVNCEYTGIHYHSIIITINHNGISKTTNHSAHGDGTLCYPNYESFLIAKIKYFETAMPNSPIYIHESIPTSPENFHNSKTCQNWS